MDKIVKSDSIDTELKTIEEELIKSDPKIFDGVPKNTKIRIVQRFAQCTKIHSGPLPDVETLDGYNKLIPDGANRVMIMAEKQSDHRIFLEKKAISSQLSQSQLGQIFAFVIVLCFISATFYAFYLGYPWPGVGLCGVSLVSIVAVFIQGKSKQRKNLENKKQ